MRRGMLMLVAILWMGFCAARSEAKWGYIPTEELVADSDLIVVGTLKDVRKYTRGEQDYGRGTIEVKEVLWGKAKPGDRLALRWSNSSRIICPRVEHKPHANKERVWLLKEGRCGTVRADYPGRVLDSYYEAAIPMMMGSTPIRVVGGLYSTKMPVTVEFIIGNASARTLVLPTLSQQKGVLHMDRRFRLIVYNWSTSRKHPFSFSAGKVVRSSEPMTTVIAPGQTYRVKVNLTELFGGRLPAESLEVELEAQGFGCSNRATVSSLSPKEYAKYEKSRAQREDPEDADTLCVPAPTQTPIPAVQKKPERRTCGLTYIAVGFWMLVFGMMVIRALRRPPSPPTGVASP